MFNQISNHYGSKESTIRNQRSHDANGKPADTRTPAQKHALITLLRCLRYDYPDAEIIGHRDLPWVKSKY